MKACAGIIPAQVKLVNFDSDTQTLTQPRHGDYIYIEDVEESEASYVRRIYEARGEDPSGYFVVIDHIGEIQYLEQIPIKRIGYAHAWRAARY